MTRIPALLVILSLALASASVTYSNNGVRKPNHNKYVACYFQSWSIYRNGDGEFQIPKIKPEYCTNLIYAFAGLNASTWEITSLDHFADLMNNDGGLDGYRSLTKLRYKHPSLKVSLAIGGWNEGSRNYSEMAKVPERRRRFVMSVVHFLRAYNFDGLDFDWEYPGARQGAEYDRFNFVTLLKELRQEFDKHNFFLTAAISAPTDSDSFENRYSIKAMADYLDYIHVMTYDYFVHKSAINPNAPLEQVNMSIQILKKTGVPAKKFVLGLPTYGRGYILDEILRSELENPIGKQRKQDSRGEPLSWVGAYNNGNGVFGYNEICKLSENQWSFKWDNLSSTPYAIFDRENKVIVYDDARSLKIKVQLAMQNGFGGVFVYSIDTDDFLGDCPQKYRRDRGNNPEERQYPLLKAINDALENDSSGSSSLATASIFLLLICLNSLRHSL